MYFNKQFFLEKTEKAFTNEHVRVIHLFLSFSVLCCVFFICLYVCLFLFDFLWGPSGTGKTTLARIICKQIDGHFAQLSAVLITISRQSSVWIKNVHITLALPDKIMTIITRSGNCLIF
jgi:Cdc6-like AAA superfamily ATPase